MKFTARMFVTGLLMAGSVLVAPASVWAEEAGKKAMGFDSDGDGKVSLDEYRNYQNKRIEAQFKRMDKNGDGYIDDKGSRAFHDQATLYGKKWHEQHSGNMESRQEPSGKSSM